MGSIPDRREGRQQRLRFRDTNRRCWCLNGRASPQADSVTNREDWETEDLLVSSW